LKIETQSLDDHQVKLTVEVEAESFEQAKRRAARQIAKRTKIPGFRPGKAPYNIVQRFVGDEAILDESLEILIRDLYPKIIEEANIEPYGPGQFNNIASLDPLTLEFTIPLMAEVKLGDYRSIQIPYELDEVTEGEVDEVVENLRRRQAIEEPVDRPAQEGDHVYLRLSGRRLDAGPEDDPTLVKERQFSAIIEKEEVDFSEEWPYPGFSRDLTGLSAGDTKSFTHTFSDDSNYESLRSVSAEFDVTVEQIKSVELPELNDEFAQTVGEYENVETLKKEIRESLEQQARETYHSDYDEQLVSEVIEGSEIKYPPQMLESEINEVIHQLEQRLKAQNLDLDTYLKTRGIGLEDLRSEATPVAESRLKRSLVLLEISQAEGIEVEKEELQAETERTLEAMTRFMSETEMRKVANEELIPNLVGNLLAEMKINRTLERLRSIAKGEFEEEASGEETGEGEAAVDEAAGPSDETIEAPAEANTAQGDESPGESSTDQTDEEGEMDPPLQSGEMVGE
jgi:trigger factor